MLVLALSDAHIPNRSLDLPSKYKKLLSIPDKISNVALLGNCTKSSNFLTFVQKISPNVTIVRGEFDETSVKLDNNRRDEIEVPLVSIIKQGEFKIGCCSGYTVVPRNDPLSLLALARQLDVDIMLWGGTHNVEAYTLEGKFFVNPGSCTGAFNTDWPVISECLQGNDEDSTIKSDDKILNSTQNTTIDKDDKKQEDVNTHSKEKIKDTKSDETDDDSLNEEDIEISDIEINGSNVPSFCLLDIQNTTCTLYIYMHIDGEVKVDKVIYNKTSEDD